MRLVCDSTCNQYTRNDIDFRCVPLSISANNHVYPDTKDCNPFMVMQEIKKTKQKSFSSCPNINLWLEAFRGANEIIAITITSGLSGSYSAALQAKNLYLEENPEAKIIVIDSLSAGPVCTLLADKAVNLTKKLPFSKIEEELLSYRQHLHITFSLHSLENLARNGRINPLIAKGIGLLNIRIIAEGDSEGKIKPVKQCRGKRKEFEVLCQEMIRNGYQGGKIKISHGGNPDIDDFVLNLKTKFNTAEIEIMPSTLINLYYGEEESILIGYEIN